MTPLGEAIYNARINAGITSKDLSFQVNRPRVFVSCLEAGYRLYTDSKTLLQMEKILGLEPKTLVKLNEKAKKETLKRQRRQKQELTEGRKGKIDLHFFVELEYREKVNELCKDYSTRAAWFRDVVDVLYKYPKLIEHLLQKGKEEDVSR